MNVLCNKLRKTFPKINTNNTDQTSNLEKSNEEEEAALRKKSRKKKNATKNTDEIKLNDAPEINLNRFVYY